MLILYCEKCGKRIPQPMLDSMGVTTADPERQYFCTECVPHAPPSAPSHPAQPAHPSRASGGQPAVSARGSGQHLAESSYGGRPPSGGVRVMRPTSGFPQAVKPATSTRAKRTTEVGRRTQTAREDISHARSAQSPHLKWIAIGSSAVLLLAAFGVFVFGGGKKPDTAVAQENAKPAEPREEKPKPSQPPPAPAPAKPLEHSPVIPAAPATPASTPPEPEKKPAEPAAHELSPKEAYDLRVKEGKIKPATPATPGPAAAPENAPASEAALLQMTDPAALREKLAPMKHDAPQAAIKHLGDLPTPAIPETVIYKSEFPKNDSPSWQSDYSSKVTPGAFEGEAGIKVENGSDRVACYRPSDFATNHTLLKFRVFQKGLNRMQISIKSVFAQRFNVTLTLPAEGKWADIVVDASKLTSDGVKFENMPLQHLEIHGFRTAPNNGAYFVISKAEFINGAK